MTSTDGRRKWLTVADEVAAGLRVDAAQRDRAGAEPVVEVEALRRSGLVTIEDWGTQQAVTRVIGAADANVGHLLGYHYLQVWRRGLFDGTVLVEDPGLFWAGVSNPLDAALKLTPTDGGFTVSGRKTFATGASVADRLVVSATRADTGAKVTFTLDAKSPGITYAGDWDNIGQRLTASGGVVFEDVPVPAERVLGTHDETSPRQSLAALGFQAVLAQVYVALAEGALAEAARYTRGTTRPWFLSGVDSATADPYVLATYGELVSDVEAAGLLADHAATALGDAGDRGAELTVEQRASVAALISSAKVVSTKVANQTTSRVFELCGARATAAGYAFDRFWRNARTLTLHDPVSYKAREVGAYFLTGERAPFTGYS
ncbi:acyl-CoA dehydrogenase family protein [Actinosynnema sp. NPDC047251]|uniref:Acyl-CoA dehydrogenase type 2 domain protein n=1 Tax=Saccharothrix espanaensis (strain ATCC 51144 / DSM 44229 / JCM 9112 / NBRC 15066 / NRRL 15764) TaxID=1179773 RepID=K0JRQ2_SACES|nr:acyl-CoA dehydrogenase family protein [Saccharothrix espanaensis]CCH28466.1 Acyl-CoA dehydrogenase type 2 domain protein [Saccharothrix espanaensis DSM 44229]